MPSYEPGHSVHLRGCEADGGHGREDSSCRGGGGGDTAVLDAGGWWWWWCWWCQPGPDFSMKAGLILGNCRSAAAVIEWGLSRGLGHTRRRRARRGAGTVSNNALKFCPDCSECKSFSVDTASHWIFILNPKLISSRSSTKKKKSAESAPFSFPSVHWRTAGITGGVGLLFEGAIEPYWTPGSRGSSPQKEDVGSNVDRSDRRGPVQPDGIRGVPSGVQGHHTRTDSSQEKTHGM